MAENRKRLLSLDLLRGADIFLLVCIGPVAYALKCALHPEAGTFLSSFFAQFDHVEWEGFRLWDIIMPLFIFMSGATIPLSGAGRGEKTFWKRLLRRVAVLWGLGMIAQGHVLDLRLSHLAFYSNTLQSIAVGYAAAAIMHRYLSAKMEAAAAAALFAAYIAVFAVWGGMDFTPGSNVCETIDKAVLGRFRDGVKWNPDGSWAFQPWYNYTWILSSLNFAVTAWLGRVAGGILADPARSERFKSAALLCGGAGMMAACFAIEPWIPCVKKLWTSSMTLFAGGISFLLAWAFHQAFDVKGWTRGAMWLRYFGANSIAAYMLHYISVRSVTDSVFYGLKPAMGEMYPLVDALVFSALITVALRAMYKSGVFLRA